MPQIEQNKAVRMIKLAHGCLRETMVVIVLNEEIQVELKKRVTVDLYKSD